jgi:hypothetical protein
MLAAVRLFRKRSVIFWTDIFYHRSQSASSAVVSVGFSSGGKCPQSSNTCKRAVGISAAISVAVASGVNSS